MRKLIRVLAGILVLGLWVAGVAEVISPGAIGGALRSITQRQQPVEIVDEDIPLAGPALPHGVAKNGWLQVKGTQLANDQGEAFQLRGMSSHGLAWYPEYTSTAAIATTRAYGANVFRTAMYVDDDAGNYNMIPADRAQNKATMYAAVDNTLSLDMYAIVDWHILKQGNPLDRLDCAVEFFEEVSLRYANEPGVIYEICNEPNGTATWEDIKAYADQVIPVIRNNAPAAIIIVGTPAYSTDLQSAMDDPLSHDGVLYAYHYYSDQQKEGYKLTLDHARETGLPVMISEWGVGNDTIPHVMNIDYAVDFLAYMAEHGTSWVNWSLCNKNETYSAISEGVEKRSNWQLEDLTEGGRLVFQALGGAAPEKDGNEAL